ncbi:hypothetical protein BpHYR1_033217 [Brachionus plicatilis]|uniref:Uncharacterized protein n=1 Tax=Brachionus plicatilis TaxID=10195 RepID=A0A3M7T8L2_BRAPC|nr:hypothetical protein BpHYR1_033217 [Brachionus plicatilis]
MVSHERSPWTTGGSHLCIIFCCVFDIAGFYVNYPLAKYKSKIDTNLIILPKLFIFTIFQLNLAKISCLN